MIIVLNKMLNKIAFNNIYNDLIDNDLMMA